MKTLIVLAILLSFNTVSASDIYKKHYDANYNLIGYSKIEAGKEIHYDTSYQRTGHTIYKNGSATKYNNKFEKIGSIDSSGTIYNNKYQTVGHKRKEGNKIIIYDNSWNRKEFSEEHGR